MLSAYCLGFQHFTVVPGHIRQAFEEIADAGFDAVCLSFSESEMIYSRRSFALQVAEAHRVGLQVHVVPSRLGGRFAGAPYAPSVWVTRHPEEALANVGDSLPRACLESPAFKEWITGFMTTLLSDYPVDGVIWDEPKGVSHVSAHRETVRRFGPNPGRDDAIRSFLDFLEALMGACTDVRPGIQQTLFVQKTDPPEFTREAARLPALSWFGYDGNFCRQSYFQEEPTWHKYRLDAVWNRAVRECRDANVESFALVENMLIPAESENEFEENARRFLSEHRPDHLSFYFYGHNNERPEHVHDSVRRLIRLVRDNDRRGDH